VSEVSVVRYGALWKLLALGLVLASVAVAFAPGTDLGKLGPLAFGAGVIAFFALVPNRTLLRLDPNTRTMNVTSRAWLQPSMSFDRTLDDVRSATVDSIDDSEFHTLNLVEDGQTVYVATGGFDSCQAAADAINAFLARTPKKKNPRTDDP
jgi:hypothetical protein